MIEHINYQLFKTLLRHSFNLAGILDKDWNWKNKDYQRLEEDIEDTLDIGSNTEKAPISRTTIKRHAEQVKLNSKHPQIKTLDVYCKYCITKGSNWCTKNNWKELLQDVQKGLIELDALNTILNLRAHSEFTQILSNVWHTSTTSSINNIPYSNNKGILEIDWGYKEIRFKRAACKTIKIRANQIVKHNHIKSSDNHQKGWSKITYQTTIKEKIKILDAWFHQATIKRNHNFLHLPNRRSELGNVLEQFLSDCKSIKLP